MTIQTKYNVGDHVFTIDKKTMKVLPFEISHIVVSADSFGSTVHLYKKGEPYTYHDERMCFESEEKLIQYVTDYGDHKEMF